MTPPVGLLRSYDAGVSPPPGADGADGALRPVDPSPRPPQVPAAAYGGGGRAGRHAAPIGARRRTIVGVLALLGLLAALVSAMRAPGRSPSDTAPGPDGSSGRDVYVSEQRPPPAAVPAAAASAPLNGSPVRGSVGAQGAGRVGSGPPPAEGPAAATVTALLRGREAALRTGNLDGWLALVDPGATAYRDRQAQLFSVLRQLPLQSWSWTVRSVDPPPALRVARGGERGAGAWLAEVVLRYRLAGYDSAEVARTRHLTVVRRGAEYRLAGDDDGPDASTQQHDLWELGPVDVVHGRASVVIGRQPLPALRSIAAAADSAVERVGALWPGGWSRRAVVLVPATEDELGALLGKPGGGSGSTAATLRQVAALTDGHVAPGGSVTGAVDRVVLHPGTFPRLSQLGRQVVLTHEVTHVATRRATPASTPLWLSEGLADYIAYRDTGVPVAVAAAGLLAQVRDDASPRLPEPASFSAPGPQAGVAYEGAWLACRMVAERYGEARLLRLYTAAGRPTTVPGAGADEALRDVLGVTPEQFLADWRAYLVRLAA